MSYTFYKLIHLIGVFMVFLSLGGLIFRGLLGIQETSLRKFGGITNGVGLLLVLIGGFGLLAKLGAPIQGWVIAKLMIWITLGGVMAVVNRKPNYGKMIFWTSLLLGGVAVFLALVKPF